MGNFSNTWKLQTQKTLQRPDGIRREAKLGEVMVIYLLDAIVT